MLAVIAAVFFAVGYIIQGLGTHASVWIVPGFMWLGLACLALHFATPWIATRGQQ